LRGFRKGWLALLLILVFQAVSNYLDEPQEDVVIRRPAANPPVQRRRKPQATGQVLAKPSSRDPLFTIETGEKSNSTGTAFAIRGDGVWLTARHVVDGCDKVGLVMAPRRALRVSRVLPHPRADMAVLWTRRSVPSLSISNDPLRLRQDGFHFGFPQAKPGQVTSSLLGRRNMRTTGRYRHTEPVVAWAERRRVPSTETLGGISGGPALNANGEIVGVTVASSKRRGRVFTTAPLSLERMLDLADVLPAGIPSAGLNTGPSDGNFTDYGTALRQQLTVAQVICRVEGGGRGRGRRRL
jgi:S1-C subfamily serine protease